MRAQMAVIKYRDLVDYLKSRHPNLDNYEDLEIVQVTDAQIESQYGYALAIMRSDGFPELDESHEFSPRFTEEGEDFRIENKE